MFLLIITLDICMIEVQMSPKYPNTSIAFEMIGDILN